jgi:NADH dehydrogenase (ubiquinone) 1 alpha subcomplex subunit 5
MRATTRLLAAVKSARFLEPGAPTGLTGLHNHPSPHSTLSYLYSSTLDKLSHLPETSVYRQSTEALTKHRLQIVEAVKPEGLEAWNERLKKKLEGMDARFTDGRAMLRHSHQGRQFLTVRTQDIGYDEEAERAVEWSGEEDTTPEQEGPISEDDFAKRLKALDGTEQRRLDLRELHLEPEPQLTAEQ